MASNKKINDTETRVKALQNNYVDLTKTGPLTYRELADLVGDTREYTPSNKIAADNQPIPILNSIVDSNRGVQYVQSDYGNSIYDPEGFATSGQIAQLDEIRAEEQPWYAQLGAGLAKGVGLLGTTFLDGTVGLLVGIGQGVSNLLDDDPKTGFWQGLWNNDVSLALNEFNNAMEEALPNYYSRDYEDKTLGRLLTMNFWANGLLKNMGFMVGAFYSGGLATKLLKGIGLVNSNLAARWVGSIFSGVNEGRVEATSLYKDTLDLSKAQIADSYDKRREEIINSNLSDDDKNILLNQLDETRASLEQDAEVRANEAAGVDLLANSILLPLDDFFTYGKLYGQGFKNVRNLGKGNTKKSLWQRSKEAVKEADKHIANDLEENIVKKGTKYEWNKITNKSTLKKGALTGLREGNEEMLQQFFSSTAGYMYQPESPDAYYKAMINNQNAVEAQDTLTAISKGFTDSYGDGSQYEQFVVGALSALIGTPTFGKVQNSSSNTYLGRGKAIGLSGGIFGELSNARDINRRGQEAVDTINKSYEKIANGKTNLAMAIGFNNDMEGYAEDDNKFEFENAKDNDLFRLFSRLVSVGREGDFRDMVDQDFDNISDEELEKIAGYTSSTPDVLNHSDGFRNEDGTLMSSTKEGRAKMREKLKERKEHLLKQMNSYKDSLGTVRGMTGNKLSPDQEDELVWLLWKSKRYKERAKEVKERYGSDLDSIIEALDSKIESLRSDLNTKTQKKDILERAILNQTNEYDVNSIATANEEAHKEIKEIQNELNNYTIIANSIKGIRSGKTNAGIEILGVGVTEKDGKADNKKDSNFFAKMLLSEDFYNQFVETGGDYVQYKNALTAVLDTAKLSQARILFTSKLAEYMSDPKKLAENRSRLEKQEANKAKDTNHVKAKDKVSRSTVSELTELDNDELSELEDLFDPEGDEEELNKLSEARKINKSRNNIREEIEQRAADGKITLEESQDAIALLEANGTDANSLEELEDINSEAILSAGIDTSELEATLQQAIEDGNGSTEEALKTLEKEKERRKDAARTVLRDSIRKVQEDRKMSDSMPKSLPEVIDSKDAPGKDAGGSNTIPVAPVSVTEKKGNNIMDYIADLASKGYSEKDIFEAIKDLNAYKEALDAGFTKEDIKQAIGDAVRDNISKKKQKSSEESDDKPIAVDSSEIDKDEEESSDLTTVNLDKEIDNSNETAYEDAPKPVNGTYTYWRPSTTEFKIHRSRGDNQPYYKDANANSATKKRYEAVWNFLKKLNVFERVKSIKTKDTVHFGISKELTEKAGIPILLILNENNEVIGDLPVQEDRGFNAYPGLDDAYKVATSYYNEHKGDSTDDIVVIPNMTSTVNAKLIGKPQYTEREDRRTLNKINTVTQADGSKKPVPFKLGVALTSGSNPRIMVTPGRRAEQGVTSEEASVQRPLRAVKGQPFMLMSTSKQRGGTSENVTVCVPISMPKFSVTSIRVANSELGKIIQDTIAKITSIKGDKDSILKWIKEVKELLALESLHVDITPGSIGPNGREAPNLVITMKRYGEPLTVLYKGPQNSDRAVTAIINNISRGNGTQINVSRKYINGKYKDHDYNTMIGALATTNLPEGATHTINDWFTINPIVDGKEQKGKGPSNIGENPNTSKNMFLLTIDGKTYGLGDDNKIYIEKGGSYVEVKASDEFKAHMYGVKYGVNMNKPYTTPWGYYNALTQKFEHQDTGAEQNRKQQLSSTLSTQSSRITFDPSTHTYTIDGKRADISVTQLLHSKSEEETDPVLGFLEVSSRLGDAVDTMARQFFSGQKVVKPKNMTDKQFTSVMAGLMKLKDQITDAVGTGWIAITDDNILRVAGIIDGKLVGGTLDMLIQDKNGKYRVIDFKTARVKDNGHWGIEGETLTQYEQQVLIYQQFLEDMYPELKGKFDMPILATFSVSYQRPKGSRKYETGDAVYTDDKGAILINGNPIELSEKYNPGTFKGLKEVRKSTTAPTAKGITPIEVAPVQRDTPTSTIEKSKTPEATKKKFSFSGAKVSLNLPINGPTPYFRTDKAVDDTSKRFEYVEKNGVIYFSPITSQIGTIVSTDANSLAIEFTGGAKKDAIELVLIEPGELKRGDKGRLLISKKAKVFVVTPDTPYSSNTQNISKAKEEGKVEPNKASKEEPKKASKVKSREQSMDDLTSKGILLSTKPERALILNMLDDATLSDLSSLPKMKLKSIIDSVIVKFKPGMSIQEVIQLFSDAGYNIGQFRRAPWWQEKAKQIYFDKVYGRRLSENDVFRINQELENLAMEAGDTVPWTLRQSYRTGNWYIAGRRNMSVTMEGYTLDNRFREVDEDTSVWNKDKELERASTMLPQLSEDGRVRLVDGLIKISDSENPGYAWGMLKRGTIVLSDRAARGTLYHESFHFVSQVLMSRAERRRLYRAAALKYGNKSIMELEELLAEDFRRYTQGIEDTEVKQMNFIQRMFSSVRDVIKGILGKNIELEQLFSEINRGRYARRKAKIATETSYRETEFSKEMQSIKDKAIADGTFMKAPNGNPTNLNERQWLQVRTKNFINWFGDWINDPKNASKVVDENGEPLVVYRGDFNNKTVFFPKSATYNVFGIYIAGNIKMAENYAKKSNTKVYEIFVNSRNPFTENNLKEEGIQNMRTASELWHKNGKLSQYDGWIYGTFPNGNGELVVDNPNQVKSATDNTGEFSTTNDDIRYRRVDSEDTNSRVMRRETQRFLDNFGITIRDIQDYEGDIPLFDALNRVINIRSVDDISEGVGYAIAFMMQHNDMMNTLMRYKLQIIPKSVRRSIRNRGDYSAQARLKDISPELRKKYIKEIGEEIATELRKLYNVEPIKVEPKSFLASLWELITEFFNMLTPDARTKFNIIRNYTGNIANSVKLNDASIILTSDTKPGTNSKAARVDIAKALSENPYERDIIEFFAKNNIALAGSASIALSGSLYRPDTNPLHDIDFNAKGYTKEELDAFLKGHFPNLKFVREINDGPTKSTETYLTLDREFTTKEITIKVKEKDEEKEVLAVGLYDKSGNQIGYYLGSELTLKEGVKGKFLDFFIGEGSSPYGKHIVNLNGKSYLVTDYRNAFQAKIDWARPKDIWDYNRFIPGLNLVIDTDSQDQINYVRERIKKAKIIWGHPAIGKTKYLEGRQDILEWDQEVNERRNEFFREQIDPNHRLDPDSKEYKSLRSQYMNEWRDHPEYVEFLTREWEGLKKRAEKENKKIFASPAPLLEIGADDFDLYLNIPEKEFLERNIERGGTKLGSMGWKQVVNRGLVQADPDKVITTKEFFSEIMKEGVIENTSSEIESDETLENSSKEIEQYHRNKLQYGNLSQEQKDYIKLRNISIDEYNDMSDLEKEVLFHCMV